MARPIAPTPCLDPESSREFLKRVEKDLHKSVEPTPTPKVDAVIERIMADAAKREK
jgi:hypothetical protein